MTREQLRKLAGDEIFAAGLQFYQNQGVREMPRSQIPAQGAQSNGLHFVVNDSPRRTVAVRADARAAVCNCEIYQQEYREHGRRVCPHVVAAILYYLASGKADEYFSRVALEAGDSLLSSYEPVIHETQLVLEPTLHVSAPALRAAQGGAQLTGQDNSAVAPATLSLRVGKRRSDRSGRMYAVRSMPKFLRGHMAKQEVEFSKSFTYQPQWMEFTQPQLPLMRLLCEIFTTIEPAERAGYKLVADARMLPIPPLMMTRLLRILSACPFRLAIGDKEFEIEEVLRDDLPLRAHLDTAGRDIELTARLEGGRPAPLDLDGEFVYQGGNVYRLAPGKRQALFPLIKQLAGGIGSFRFQPRQAERVISELLPQLKLAATVSIGDNLKKRIVNEKLKPRVYLERQGTQSTVGGISARVKFCYGDLEIDPFAPAGTLAISESHGPEEGFSEYDPDDPMRVIVPERRKETEHTAFQPGERLLMRDAEGERSIIDVLSGYGFKVRLGEVHLTGQDEIYEFFVEGIKELSKVCEVYCSDSFRRMTPRKLVPRGRSCISDGKLLLSLEGELGELPPQELVAILAALRDRKKFFRLHDGSMLSLDDIGQDWLELADAVADAGVVRQSGVLELESYRATYLNSLLGNLTNMQTDASVENASHLEAPSDPCPEELGARLRPYQERGFEWLQALYKLHLGGVLADDMGLGKTLQMISVMLYARLHDGRMPSLVVAPTTLTYNWLNELRKFAPQLNSMVLDGSRQKRQELIEQLREKQDVDVLITSYPLIRRDGELLSGFKFRFCILDEAQNIKNAQSVGAEAVRQIDALSRFALTGTPMENHPGELWSIFNFVMPGYLLSSSAFMRQHGQGQNSEQLKVKLRPFLLRRLKRDVLPELPEKVEQTIIAEPTPEQLDVYRASLLRLRGHVQELLGQNEGGPSAFGRNRIEVLSAITELRQICCHPSLCLDSYAGSSGKLELLMDILPSALENGHRVLLFSQFTSMLALIRERLAQEGIGCLYLDGQTPAEERMALVERFNSGMEKSGENSDVPDVFLISLKAGGSGLNLTGADMVIHYDPWWNPAVEDQATDRVHRIGQTRSVQVLRLITKDTVEQGVLEMSQRKRALFDQVITAGDTIPTQLTEDEILALFQMD